jgi:tRNA A-37 threonylcarbamoyl transferase component Bud32
MTDEPKSPGTPPVNPISPTLGAAMIDLPERVGIAEVGPPPPPLDPYLGTTLDNRYVIERMLGEGGMGVVYAGRHQVIDKRVAIKVLRRDMANDDEVNERFLQEARAASAIGNEHIVDISDFGRLPDGSTYFVMELLEGESLSDVLEAAKGPLTMPRLCHIGKQIAEGLAAAHAANIVHRDLKPDNVMLIERGSEGDFVKILDFGIAKVGNATKKVTRAGSVFGTPHYMSPEQAAGAVVDIRTDVYALGVILYEMATGKVPFDADNFMGILTQHMYKAPVPIRALVPEVDVPAGLDAIVLKCLTKKPEGRYPSMDTLLADLEKVDQGVLPDAVQEMMARSGAFNVPADYFRSSGSMMAVPVPAESSDGPKRWPLYAVIATLATVLGVFGAVVLARTSVGEGRATQTEPPAAPASLAPPLGAPLPAAPGATAVEQGAQPASAALMAREILVSVVPSDATIARDGKALGQSPVALHLRDGEEASLVLDRKGFKTKTVTVNAEDPKQAFTLDAVPVSTGAPARRPPAVDTPTRAAAPPAIDDIGDPFAPKH